MPEAINPHRGPVIAVGECMVELAKGTDGRFGLAYGGDTFNTAVYLARAGVDVAYATALGDDPYSSGIVELARAEGVGTHPTVVVPGRMPGLYLIETNAQGERTFYYWRDRSPARELLDGPGAAGVIEALTKAGLVYFSGITLSLYSDPGLARFAAALAAARTAGATIVMDSNFRPRGWPDRSRAQSVMGRFWALSDVGLPTFDDEAQLWGDRSPQATAARLCDLGVREIAVKLGSEGALVRAGSQEIEVPAPQRIKAIDTTGAGDSFNAAYLAARMRGLAAEAAARAGHRLAGVVIQHRGAIVPRDATAEALSALRASSPPGAPAQ
ncbi:MAG TPA: sugar kinase [Hyphomicrobiaceae bacterium]|nr:sugar kinase [Hyphomicrobiaceae bacterium]